MTLEEAARKLSPNDIDAHKIKTKVTLFFLEIKKKKNILFGKNKKKFFYTYKIKKLKKITFQ